MIEKRILKYIYELFHNTPRQGPGSFDCTQKAFKLCRELPDKPLVLDLGCGSGTQTLDLARLCNGRIIAVDSHQAFVDKLAEKVQAQDLERRISPRTGDMADPPAPEGPFDLIWCEGAIYNVGFERGLALWRKLLKPGGYVGLTEAAWFRPDIPQECLEFWEQSYPGIRPVEKQLEAARQAGYRVMGNFPLPRRCWWEEFYVPLQDRIEEMDRKYADTPEAGEFLKTARYEIQIYENYSDYYGYEFFVLRRAD